MKTLFLMLAFYVVSVFPAFPQSNADKTEPPRFVCGETFKDSRDEKTYNTVLIGSQCWMKENLNIGSRIKGTQEQADNGIIEKYCYDDLDENCDVYGGIYQWNEVMQYKTSPKEQGVCPTGWHIPDQEEWDTLVAFLGGDVAAGGKMKEAGSTHYLTPNFGATNKSGFTALPGGYSYATGSYYFDKLHGVGYFWSSTTENETDVWIRTLGSANERIGRYLNYKTTGSSVRCLLSE
ncbi:MAG: FISUMP domain-containing protein [Bacteroidales bacterium]|nr:FISUMP domain-containing protein [Bacteroidales bacterium]